MADYPLTAGAGAADANLPQVRDAIVVLEDITPADDLVMSRLGNGRLGVHRKRATDDPTTPVFRLVLASHGGGFTLRQLSEAADSIGAEELPHA